jgi:phosphatidate cytidylyltransferase
MPALAVIALWLGGIVWTGFVVLVAGIVLWEWNRLVGGFGVGPVGELAWLFFGVLYIGAAAMAMVAVRTGELGFVAQDRFAGYDVWTVLLAFIAPVIAVDVGAYFMGRLVGGPLLLPSVSPSKTWAGLVGGMLAASVVTVSVEIGDIGPATVPGYTMAGIGLAILSGVLIAVIAQAGDFFESWMKRRAGVKDSAGFIPGHGGIFDRLDGFIAVYFVLFVLAVVPAYLGT